MQFPLQVRVWPIARVLRGDGEFDLAARIVLLLRKARARIDPDWVLGSIGWTALVYIIVHFGAALR